MERYISENEILCSNVKRGDMVLVHSSTYNSECWAYVHELYEYGLAVQLELPEEHPSVQEAIADSGYDFESIELDDIIPFDKVEYIRRLPSCEDIPLKVWKRPLTSSERAERAKRRGFTRLALPELDAHFDGKYR